MEKETNFDKISRVAILLKILCFDDKKLWIIIINLILKTPDAYKLEDLLKISIFTR